SRPAATTSTGMAMRRTVLVSIRPRSSQMEVGIVAPREDEVVALSPEERAGQDKDGPHHQEDGEQRYDELAVLRLRRGVAVRVGRQDEADQRNSGDRDTGHHGVEHGEQFLQPQEVP